jgi:hypothetical protein
MSRPTMLEGKKKLVSAGDSEDDRKKATKAIDEHRGGKKPLKTQPKVAISFGKKKPAPPVESSDSDAEPAPPPVKKLEPVHDKKITPLVKQPSAKKTDMIRAHFSKGSMVKTLGEAIAYYNRVRFRFTKKGLYILDADEKDTKIAIDRCFFSFNGFRPSLQCLEPISFTITSKQFQAKSKGIKVKDLASLVVRDRASRMLIIEVKSNSGQEIVETHPIPFQEDAEDTIDPAVPGDDMYLDPVTISSSGFQRAKKKDNSVSCLSVEIQSGAYLEISHGEGSSSFVSGVKDDDAESFKAKYDSKLVSRLTKLAGFGDSISFYPPKSKGIPLKVEVIPKVVGSYVSYMKDVDMVEEDAALAPEPAPSAAPKRARTKKKGGRTI